MELLSSDFQSFKAKELRSLLVLVLSLAIAFTASASSQGINFNLTAFDGNSIQHHGVVSVSSNSIQLTNRSQQVYESWGWAPYESVGWATYREPLRLWDMATGNVADFTTRFTFVINSQNEANFSDGMTFFLVPQGSQLPINSKGGCLAIINPARDPSSSSDRFVAVEFDTYHDEVLPVVMDPDCPKGAHVGIDLNNLNSTAHTCVDWFKDKIMSGGRINAMISYNSSTQNLSVVVIDADATGTNINSAATSDIVNLTEYLPEWVTFGFSAAVGVFFETHTIEAWEFRSNAIVAGSNVRVAGKKSELWLWATLGSGSFSLLVLALAFIWFRHRSKRKETYMSGEEDDLAIDEAFEHVPGPKKFYYKDLVAATDNFTIEWLLGEGGFGRVYKGYLTSMNAHVAIKKISPESRQGIKEYATEVKTISRLRHKNLVQLSGWCHEKKELLLIYEYMSNGSLDSHLFKERTFLPWEKRYKIAQGTASALLYLHEEWEQCVVHRDIKSSNIMLDSDFNAKLGDFGLARLVDHAKGLQTTVLAGTMGYMAPECVYTGKASRESDVYSFGVVLLEIACGRKVIEPRAEEGQVRLVDWVWELYGIGRILDAVDSKLGTDFDEKQLECSMAIGLWCAHPDPIARPSIREAFSVLNFNAQPPVLPSKLPVPTYLVPVSSFTLASNVLSSNSCTKMSALTTSSPQSAHTASSALLLDTK